MSVVIIDKILRFLVEFGFYNNIMRNEVNCYG